MAVENVGEEEAPGPIVATVRLPPEVSFVGLGGRSGFTCVGGDLTRAGQLVTCFQDGPLEAGKGGVLDLSVWYEGSGDVEVCADVAPAQREAMHSDVCAELTIWSGRR